MMLKKFLFSMSLALFIGTAYTSCLFGTNEDEPEKLKMKFTGISAEIQNLKGRHYKSRLDWILLDELELLSKTKYFNRRRCGLHTGELLERGSLLAGENYVYRFYMNAHADLCLPRYEKIFNDEVCFWGREDRKLTQIVDESVVNRNIGSNAPLEVRVSFADEFRQVQKEDIDNLMTIFTVMGVASMDIDLMHALNVPAAKVKEVMPYVQSKFESMVLGPCQRQLDHFSDIFYPFELDKKWVASSSKKPFVGPSEDFMNAYIQWKVCKTLVNDKEWPEMLEKILTETRAAQENPRADDEKAQQ